MTAPKAFEKRYLADLKAAHEANTPREMAEHVAETIEGKRLWTFGSAILSVEDMYDRAQRRGGILNSDTIAVGPWLTRINREGGVVTVDSQAGLEEQQGNYLVTQRAYLEFLIEKRRIPQVVAAFRKAGLRVDMREWAAKNAPYALTWEKKVGVGGRPRLYTTSRGRSPMAHHIGIPMSTRLQETLLSYYDSAVVIAPKPKSNAMWPIILRVLRENP